MTSLSKLGYIGVKKKLTPVAVVPERIMIFGTFDIIHKGHRNFFKQARELAKNPFLIVSIARATNVKRIKGRAPRHTDQQRLAAIAALPEVDKVVLGGARQYIPHIVRERPDIIALGYDQIEYVKGLRTALIVKGLKPKIVRLKPYKEHIYKTSIIDRT